MDCRECGVTGGEPVRVEYTDGNGETLPLCEQCRERFTDGDLINRVEAVDAEGSPRRRRFRPGVRESGARPVTLPQ